jgi:hypothetical protein
VLLTPRLPPAVACPHPAPHCPCPRSAAAPGGRAPLPHPDRRCAPPSSSSSRGRLSLPIAPPPLSPQRHRTGLASSAAGQPGSSVRRP